MFSKSCQNDFEYILSKIPVDEIEGSDWLITGASGFMMTYLIQFLLYANNSRFTNPCRLYLLCRSRDKLLKRLGLSSEPPEVCILEQDVTEKLSLDFDVDYVIHAASIAATRLFASNPVEVILANTVGLNNVLSSLKGKKIRSVLFFSSGAVYGDTPDDVHELRERDYYPLNFADIGSCYAESKRLGELLMYSYWSEYGLPCRCVRISHTYGPGIDLDDGHVYSDFVKALLNDEDLVINGDGMASRPFCYIADAVIAYLLILCKGQNGESYNMANNSATYSIYELARTLADKVAEGRVGVIRKKKPQTEGNKVFVNTTKLEALGWSPEIGVAEGFKRTVKSFCQ